MISNTNFTYQAVTNTTIYKKWWTPEQYNFFAFNSVLNNDSYDNVLVALEKTLKDGLKVDEVSASNPKQCRWRSATVLKMQRLFVDW